MLKDTSMLLLVGGQAKRFQGDSLRWIDKLTISHKFWNNLPLIVHQVKRFLQFVPQIILVTSDEARKAHYAKLLAQYELNDIKIIFDEPVTCMGPLRGIHAGLKSVENPRCLVLPGDVPFIREDLLQYLHDSLRSSDLGFFVHEDGRLESLIISLKTEIIRGIIQSTCFLSKRRITDLIRGSNHSIFVPYTKKLQTTDGWEKNFVNINSPGDLDNLGYREASGSFLNPFQIQMNQLASNDWNRIANVNEYSEEECDELIQRLEEKQAYYWIGSLYEEWAKKQDVNDQNSKRSLFDSAARSYQKEFKKSEACPVNIIRQHIMNDVDWCSDQSHK